jgi:hypothetical protein
MQPGEVAGLRNLLSKDSSGFHGAFSEQAQAAAETVALPGKAYAKQTRIEHDWQHEPAPKPTKVDFTYSYVLSAINARN